jgi:hypothetical protein
MMRVYEVQGTVVSDKGGPDGLVMKVSNSRVVRG